MHRKYAKDEDGGSSLNCIFYREERELSLLY